MGPGTKAKFLLISSQTRHNYVKTIQSKGKFLKLLTPEEKKFIAILNKSQYLQKWPLNIIFA